MKTKDKNELKQSDVATLTKKADDIREKLAAMKISRYTNPSKNVRERKILKKNLAVTLTYIREKELTHE